MMHNQEQEINKFNDKAHEWWNDEGEFRTLHHINPIRLDFVNQHAHLKNKTIIDVGCGGGIFAESMANSGGLVTGIDLAPQSIEVAKLHLYESNLNIAYECISTNEMAKKAPEQFDVLTCMEMLEHVPTPAVIIEDCAKLVKPNGYAFFSTLNRNLKSYLLGVIAAEYLLKLVPKGTHEYQKFIKPSELRSILNKSGLQLIDIKGIAYNPFTHTAKLSHNTDINYIICCQKIS